MEDNLIEIKVEIHKKQLKEMQQTESELIKLISESENKELKDKMIDWINQRTICNETYIALAKTMKY